jgi:hypothetical protein
MHNVDIHSCPQDRLCMSIVREVSPDDTYARTFENVCDVKYVRAGRRRAKNHAIRSRPPAGKLESCRCPDRRVA